MKSTISEGDPLVLQLVFPAEWRQPRNPLAEPAAAWARTFLAEFGFLNDPETEEKLNEIDVAGFGWPFYAAERPVLCTVTAFLAHWALYARRRATRGEADEAALVSAVRGEGTRPADPYHAAFWELGQRYYKKLGRTFLARHGERFRAWLRATPPAGAEAPPAPANLDAYLALRRTQIGLLPVLDFLELDLGEELPAEIWHDPRMGTLERLSCEVVALQHDLRAFAAGSRQPNAVRLLAAAAGLLPALAGARIALRHNQLVAEIDRVGRALVRDHRTTALTAWWIRLSGLLAGFGRYHAAADRERLAGGRGGPGYSLSFGQDDDFDEPALSTAVWRLPQVLSAFAAPPAG